MPISTAVYRITEHFVDGVICLRMSSEERSSFGSGSGGEVVVEVGFNRREESDWNEEVYDVPPPAVRVAEAAKETNGRMFTLCQ
jgi:hypothetical protein